MSVKTDFPDPVRVEAQTDDLIRRFASVRDDFPALTVEVHGVPVAYLDNAATAHKPARVIERITRYYESENSNVHRGVHTMSQTATAVYEKARERVRSFINAGSTSEIVFTRGTTEAINLVASSFGSTHLRPGDEILLTQMEHHSNIVPWQLIAKRTGAVIRVVQIDDRGVLQYDDFEQLLSDKTKILAVTHVSNALGTVNPVRRLIRDAHGLDIPVLVDGAQAIPHQAVDVRSLDCDFYCFSGHKMFGPTGIGVLYGKEALLEELPPYQGGGDMIESVSFDGTTFNELPYKFEAGTPNVAGAAGIHAAIDYLHDIGFQEIKRYEALLLDYALRRLRSIDGIRLIGEADDRAGVVSFLLGKAHPYDVGTILDRLGIAVRTGHHCAEPLMRRFGISGTIRASMAFYNTFAEIDRLCSGLTKASSILSGNA